VSAIIVSLDEYKFHLAQAEYDKRARQLRAQAAARARADGRVPVTRPEVEDLISNLLMSLGELEILRERLAREEAERNGR
jgi:hypothetical protein